ncbi:hydrolase, TatD family [Treponema primitia ZAS-2]|uniref:Hydrolase, TatD family n=1 Tax=Treponema primitia (strain ATCC BAA-887 / DSM 12427 / ZAS-2) TaxID=545694 RepID=F5YII6_TREPZ|nr:TatD family hydrolase [Treponema primitia]AEF84112.1 hydrolase, TatD family [Treponema primitia ZAS-2]
MASDAHAHPYNLLERFPGAEEERRSLGVACAASAWNGEQFAYHRELARSARKAGAAPMALCFALHPQLPAAVSAGDIPEIPAGAEDGPAWAPLLDLLETLAEEGALNAVGETGFDLYDARFRATEAVQDELFALHLETALRYALPLVIHVRRAMHKIFAHTGSLKKLPAVVFHSWSGTAGEGAALLRRGVNAYFSFGASIVKNHKEAIRSCAALPLDHLLLETDAPYQPLRGREFSRWADLSVILKGAAQIRHEAGVSGSEPAELEAETDHNFNGVFFPQAI